MLNDMGVPVPECDCPVPVECERLGRPHKGGGEFGLSSEVYSKTPHCGYCDKLLPGTVAAAGDIIRPDGWF